MAERRRAGWRPLLVIGTTAIVALAGPTRAQDAATAPPPAVTLPPAAPVPPPAVAIPALTPRQADQLRTLLARARSEGIGEVAAVAPGDDHALVTAALDTARSLRIGRLAPSDFLPDWGLRPEPYDPTADLVVALSADQVGSWIASLSPPYAGYDGLRRGLARYRAIAAAGGWPTLADGPTITPATTGARVIALRQRLAVEDADVATGGDHVDAALIAAIQRVQRRYGLEPTGTVNAATLAALNVSADDRVAQIVANMERWRWLPRALPENRIQVNIAAAVLTVFDGDQPVESMRAVTGRPDDETPMLSSTIHSIVINPPWNVPSTIAAKELLPKEKAHPGYLKRNGFKVIQTADGGTRLQQIPAHSALGHFKFDFDNPYSVYLHDTPTQSTFSTYSRLASHGCVRLQKPKELATLLLKDDPNWGEDAIDAAVAKGDTLRVHIPNDVAVYLLYWTAFASADGTMNFRGDPYSWDKLLAAKVAARARSADAGAAATSAESGT